MALRHFTDEAGGEWTVYDVVPRIEERRADERRRGSDDIGTEDRRIDDRRVTVGPLSSRLTSGWLCFEKGDDRRRLQPIPGDWLSLNDEQLAQLLLSAKPANLRRPAESQP